MREYTIEEQTNEKDRTGGFRHITLASENADSRSIIAVTVHRAENCAFIGDRPEMMTLPGEVDSNHTLGLALLHLASELLQTPHLSGLASNPARSFCHEG